MSILAINTTSHWASLLDLILTPAQRRARRNLIDLRDLPDHLKRDVGMLDGHETPQGR